MFEIVGRARELIMQAMQEFFATSHLSQNVMDETAKMFNACLRVLKKDNKSRYDSFFVKNLPYVDDVVLLKEELLQRCQQELTPCTA